MAQTTNRKKAHCTAPTKGLLQGDNEAETQEATLMATPKARQTDETTDQKKAHCSN